MKRLLLEWNNVTKGSSVGMFPKAVHNNKYYKMSAYTRDYGVYGINSEIEVLSYRILKYLGFTPLEYRIECIQTVIDNKELIANVCVSDDFTNGSEDTSLERYYSNNKLEDESVLEFVKREGKYPDICEMIVADYLINNIDRHGNNIRVLSDGRWITLFDNGLALMASQSEDKINSEYVSTRANNFIGIPDLEENLINVGEPVNVTSIRIPENVFTGLGFSSKRINETIKLVESRLEYARDLGVIKVRGKSWNLETNFFGD